MRKNRLYAVLVLSAAATLAGCSLMKFSGPPCMGNACPAGAHGEPPAPAHAQTQQAPSGNAPAQASAATQSPAASSAQVDNTQANAAPASANQPKPSKWSRLIHPFRGHPKS